MGDEKQATLCKVEDGDITITLRIAFSGADDPYINRVKNEIESIWNGPNGYQTCGRYRVKFEVETKKITNHANVNCEPPPIGYHCIMVTPYDTNPPRDTSGIRYIGYLYPPGVSQRGHALKGWWSDQMSRPVPGGNGERYKDFTHEAGHMMGLADNEDNGIMTHTKGLNAKPTQANIEKVVENICGAGTCSDK